MVEFVRDVVVVVAILVTLVAVALNHTTDTDASDGMDQPSRRTIEIPGVAPSHADAIVTSPPAPQANAR